MMTRFLAAIFVLLFAATLTIASAGNAAAAPVKQGEFAYRLVDALGWGEGLPDSPTDKDYLAILEGNRTFRFEAEETFDRKNDPVSIRNYPLFGAFSGKGWVHGPTTQTAVHFKVFVPISGNYILKAATKGDGQIWSIAGKGFKLDAGENFQELTVGQVFIPAGPLEFNAVIPPGGALDYFTIEAPPYQAVAPLAGWDFAATLSAATVNEVAASLLASEQNLPLDPSFGIKSFAVSSTAKIPAEAMLTDTQIYGKPTTGKWVRTSQKAAEIVIPFEVDATSVYSMRARVFGSAITAGFDQRLQTVAGRPILDWVDIGTFRLNKGSHTIHLNLPPAGGVDAVEISRRLTSAEAYAAITKTAKSGPLVQQENVDPIIKSLQEQFKARR